MAAPDIYVGGKKETLIELLEAALRSLRESTVGSVSVPMYANPTDGTITFTDEDTANDGEGVVTIEEF
jgi:hypothetical protein